jgi:hypothetical protein
MKRPGREADLSLPTSAEVNKTWGLYPPIRPHGVMLSQISAGTLCLYVKNCECFVLLVVDRSCFVIILPLRLDESSDQVTNR